MKNNNIPITDARTDDQTVSAEIETVETELAVETATDIVQDDSVVEEPVQDDASQNDSEEVEGQVTLAIKVTKKQRLSTKRDAASQEEYAPRYEAPTRKPASKRPVSFNPLAWVADGVTGAIEEVRHNDLGLSEDFWKHLYAVRREGLLTAQALVVSLIERVESKSDELEERKQRRERRGSVDIDF